MKKDVRVEHEISAMRCPHLLVAFAACVAAGCSAAPGPTTGPASRPAPLRYTFRRPEYGWGFFNVMPEAVTNVDMSFAYREGRIAPAIGGVVMSSGDVPLPEPGGGARSMTGTDPIPARVTVVWRTADGQDHRQDVAVAPLVPDPPDFSGIIWFRIARDGVTVVPETFEEEEARAAAASQAAADRERERQAAAAAAASTTRP